MSVSATNSSLQIIPPPGVIPLVVFINPKSGGKQGSRLLRKFQYLLNPRQVFNLMQDGGPIPGLRQFQDINCRIMVAGGDGTVGWLLDAMGETGVVCPSDPSRCLYILPPINDSKSSYDPFIYRS